MDIYIYEQKMRREVAILQAIVQEMKWRQGAEGKTKFLEEEERQVVEETARWGGARDDRMPIMLVPYIVNGGLVMKFKESANRVWSGGSLY